MKETALQTQRDILQASLDGSKKKSLLASITQDEIESHFEHMPLRYWGSMNRKTLFWHLEALHSFFEQLVHPKAKSVEPVVSWKHYPKKSYSEVLVCTWDRLGLFSKVAGSFALSGINIISADIYTRNDDLVLDLFRVCDLKKNHVSNQQQMNKMLKTLKRSLNGKDEVSFSEIFRKKARAQVSPKPLISFNNQDSEDYTILKIKTRDHHGLLYSVLQVLTLNGFDIAQAKTNTRNTHAIGEFYITDTKHRKVIDRLRLNTIRDLLLEMVTCLEGSKSVLAV